MAKKEKQTPALREIASFIKESMVVSGSVKFVKLLNLKLNNEALTGALFQVKDKKRGKFYISWMVEFKEN